MRRYFRHMRSSLAIVLLLVAGIWLSVPRDICLTKLLAGSDCTCAAMAETPNGCPCCEGAKAGRSLPCGDHSGGEADPGSEEHSSNCLLVSSELSKMQGSERVHHTSPVMDVLAVLPVAIDLPQQVDWSFNRHPERNLALNDAGSYRDNCVYLI